MSIIGILTQRAMKLAMMKIVRGRKRFLGERLPKPTIYYFGYGGNLDPDRFKKYQMNAEAVGVAKIPDYTLNFSLPCEYLGNVEPSPGQEVWGYLYKMDSPSLGLLDVMEWAVLNQYRRVEILSADQRWKEYQCAGLRCSAP